MSAVGPEDFGGSDYPTGFESGWERDMRERGIPPILAATTLGGERGALAACVLEWPPHRIIHVAQQVDRNRSMGGDARVVKAAWRLERMRRRP